MRYIAAESKYKFERIKVNPIRYEDERERTVGKDPYFFLAMDYIEKGETVIADNINGYCVPEVIYNEIAKINFNFIKIKK